MSTLREIAADDWPEISRLRDGFRAEARHERPDRNVLSQLSQQALDLQIKHLPALNARIDQQLPSKNRCLITSLGMRTDPIVLTIAIVRPKCVVFVHTEESRDRVEELTLSAGWQQVFGERAPTTESIQVDPADTTGSYGKLSAVLQQGKKSNWIVDITGGKKAMGAILSAFAFWRRIPVVYLDSQEVLGVPEPFSERLIHLDNPYDTYGDPLLKAAELSYNSHQYAAAIEALGQLRDTVSVVDLDHQASVVLELVQSYLLWDRFEHSRDDQASTKVFYDGFKASAEKYRRFGYHFFDSGVLEANCNFVMQLEQAYRPSKAALIDPYRQADIFCNSERRGNQGLFDDAVARLYRCIEMAATLALKRLAPSFDPDRADWQALRADFAGIDLDGLFAEKSKNAGYPGRGLPDKQEIGVGQQMTLVGALAEAILLQSNASQDVVLAAEAAKGMYEIYEGGIAKRNLLSLRNRSILAHGTRPLDRKTYEDFRSVSIKICEHAVRPLDWRQLVRNATFPKMTLTS